MSYHHVYNFLKPKPLHQREHSHGLQCESTVFAMIPIVNVKTNEPLIHHYYGKAILRDVENLLCIYVKFQKNWLYRDDCLIVGNHTVWYVYENLGPIWYNNSHYHDKREYINPMHVYHLMAM